MKQWMIAFGCALAMASPAHAQGDDNAPREVMTQYDLVGFNKIKASGAHILNVQQGEAFSVRTEATTAAAPRSVVRLDGDTLVLVEAGDVRNRGKNDSIKVVISMPSLSEIDASGGVQGTVSGLDVSELSIDASGGVSLVLKGQCETLEVDASGGARIDATDLTCDVVDANASGAARLDVHATRTIDANASGMGKIWVQGNPADRRKYSLQAANIFIR